MQNTLAVVEPYNLPGLGNVVPEGYNYYNKKVTAGTLFNLPGACLKWYYLYPVEKEISRKQTLEAKAFLEAEVKTGRLILKEELGFVILHRAGDYLLMLLNTWRNTNEIWESSYMKNITHPESFIPFNFENIHRGTYCVWELGIVWHERNAWVRFIESGRDDQAKTVYMNDLFSGMI